MKKNTKYNEINVRLQKKKNLEHDKTFSYKQVSY